LLHKHTNDTHHLTQSENKQQAHRKIPCFCWRTEEEEEKEEEEETERPRVLTLSIT
jgi:hypothetical protein